ENDTGDDGRQHLDIKLPVQRLARRAGNGLRWWCLHEAGRAWVKARRGCANALPFFLAKPTGSLNSTFGLVKAWFCIALFMVRYAKRALCRACRSITTNGKFVVTKPSDLPHD